MSVLGYVFLWDALNHKLPFKLTANTLVAFLKTNEPFFTFLISFRDFIHLRITQIFIRFTLTILLPKDSSDGKSTIAWKIVFRNDSNLLAPSQQSDKSL